MVDETQQYSAAEMERMMKVQDVLLKAMAKKITWWAAAEIIGVRIGRCAAGGNVWRRADIPGWRIGARENRARSGYLVCRPEAGGATSALRPLEDGHGRTTGPHHVLRIIGNLN